VKLAVVWIASVISSKTILPMSDYEPPAIRLEPRKIFDRAIVGYTADNWAVYDYEKLIGAVKVAHKIRKRSEAEEWVDYNIGSFEGLGLRISYRQEQL
jgi:hypothetical protein